MVFKSLRLKDVEVILATSTFALQARALHGYIIRIKSDMLIFFTIKSQFIAIFHL